MKLGFIFPGQGAQALGMGKDLYDEFETYRNVYKKVDEITGLNLEELTFNSSEEELSKTNNTQIAILTMSLAILALLKEKNIEAKISSGLSLGEYSALIYSNILSLEDGVKVVKSRGEFMQSFCPKGDWSMVAVLGADEELVNSSIKEVKDGFASIANLNCPGQIVVSGDKDGIASLKEILISKGVKRVIELKTSGPFHTEKLVDASNKLKGELEKITFNKSEKIVFKNLDGKVYLDSSNYVEILANHITHTVRYEDCLKGMIEEGVDTFVEIGPGKTLSGFVKRINKEIPCYSINNLESYNNFLENINK